MPWTRVSESARVALGAKKGSWSTGAPENYKGLNQVHGSKQIPWQVGSLLHLVGICHCETLITFLTIENSNLNIAAEQHKMRSQLAAQFMPFFWLFSMLNFQMAEIFTIR